MVKEVPGLQESTVNQKSYVIDGQMFTAQINQSKYLKETLWVTLELERSVKGDNRVWDRL